MLGSIPSSVATFSGKWVGVWGYKLAGTLVVQKIYPADSKGAHKAEGIYSWGSAPSWRISPGFRLFEGQIQDGKLQFEIMRADLTYTLSNNPDVLEGTYRIRGISTGSFTRVKE